MSSTFVQAGSFGTDSTVSNAISLTLGAAVGSGNNVAGSIAWGNGTTGFLTSVDDDKGNSYTIIDVVADATNGGCMAQFYGLNITNAPATITGHFSGTIGFRGITAIEFSGAVALDGSNHQARLQATPGVGTDGCSSGASTLTPSASAAFVYGGSNDTGTLGSGASLFTAGTGFTEPAGAEWAVSGQVSISSEYQIQTSAAAVNASFTAGQASGHITGMLIFIPSTPNTQDQNVTRFGNDDASESAHTFAAAENTNITAPLALNLLLRLLVDASSGDPGALAYTLRYQKNGSGGYVPVPVGATTIYPLPTWQSAGTAASGTAAVTAPVPASFAAGDLLLMVVETANQAVATPPSGWTEVSASPQGTGTAAGTTATRLTVYAKIATGSEAAVSIGDAGDHTLVNTFAIRGVHQTLATALHVVAGDVAATGSTSVTCPGGTTTVNNCLIVNIVANATDTATAQGSGWANANLGSVTEQLDFGTASGNGGGITVITGTLATAGSIGGTTGTLATSSVQGRITLAIRPPADVTNDVYVSASSNIASGGEATTARLTPPSGKTTSNFTTGRRWDDENGTDTIDIASGGYTELEWCLQAQSPAANGDAYTFRVYQGGGALDTYTSTPQWTIGSAGAAPVIENPSLRPAMMALLAH